MSKHKKHLKTDRRSVERRKAHLEKKREEASRIQNKMVSLYAPRSEMFKAADEGRVFRPSIKQLKKWKREQEAGAVRTETVPESGLTPAEQERIRQANLKKQWIKRKHEENIEAFQRWKYKNPVHNIHGYAFYHEEDIPFMNPQNAKEIKRDRELWELFHEALENPDIEEARKLYQKALDKETEILRAQFETQEEFNAHLNKQNKLSIRSASSINMNQDWLNYYNYLEAATVRGLGIFAQAIQSGGKEFVKWLYEEMEFDWSDFYENEDGEITSDASDAKFKVLAKENQNNPKFGNILKTAYEQYKARDKTK